MTDLEPLLGALRGSQMLRVCLVGVLTVVLLIPIAMIGGLVSERQSRYGEAAEEVSASWGKPQLVSGPALVVPYTERAQLESDEGTRVVTTTHYAVILPSQLEVVGDLETEDRSRGIFSVPVYTADMRVAGSFAPPELGGLGIDPNAVDWERARLVVGMSDVRAILEGTTLTWNGMEAGFLPGTIGFGGGQPGIQAPIPAPNADGFTAFSFSMSFNGSESLYWVPFGENTRIEIVSNSPYPSFQGNWLPTDRRVSDEGFEAVWEVSYLGRNYPQAWTSPEDPGAAIGESRFGVEIGAPIDLYRMAERSVKYAGLFVLLTFATVWLTEVLAGVRVHPIQYLMLGAALCVFYLLELSLAEHVGFNSAYGIASVSILAMVVTYGRTIFGDWRRAAWAASGVGALYVYLFVLLANEESALMFGSIGLFVVLAAIMFVTRRINWYAGPVQPTQSGSANT